MALAVIAGAMGAHALQTKLEASQLASFETAVRYQLFHSLALLLLSNINTYKESKLLQRSALLMCLGLILFSGSIYLLCTRTLTGWDSLRVLWPVTPLGGILMIVAWLLAAWYFIKQKDESFSS